LRIPSGASQRTTRGFQKRDGVCVPQISPATDCGSSQRGRRGCTHPVEIGFAQGFNTFARMHGIFSGDAGFMTCALVVVARDLLGTADMKIRIALAVVVIGLALTPVVVSIGVLVLVPLAITLLPVVLFASVLAIPALVMAAARGSEPHAIADQTIEAREPIAG
jgi:hypothetical protein